MWNVIGLLYAFLLRKLQVKTVLIILMTNSMLTTLSNSALKFSLEDKHVGYVLYSGRALSSIRPP